MRVFKFRFLILFAFTVIIGLGFCTKLVIKAQSPTGRVLFRDAFQVDTSVSSDNDPSIIRSRGVEINFDLLEQANMKTGETIVLNLFDNLSFTAVFERWEQNLSGSSTWIGHLEGIAYSSVVLVIKDGHVFGNILLPGQAYGVRPIARNSYVIHQIDTSSIFAQDTDDALFATRSPLESASTDMGIFIENGSVIDLMVAYTPAARDEAGGTAAMQSKIEAAVAQANTAFPSSGINTRLRLVHTVEVNYTESTEGTTLERSSLYIEHLMGKNDGFMDEIHTLRDTYSADLVALAFSNSDYYTCFGIGGLPSALNPRFDEDTGFSAIEFSCYNPAPVMTHELGHNLGAHHDWWVYDVSGGSGGINGPPGLYSYNKGYVNTSKRWRTIMSYPDHCSALGGIGCEELLAFSNPDILYNGDPMGVPAGTNLTCTAGNLNNPPCDADNHRMINNFIRTVANYRISPTSVKFITSGSSDTTKGGDVLNYTLQVTNTGMITAGKLVLINPIPPNTTLNLASLSPDSFVVSGGPIIWIIEDYLAPGASLERSFAVTVDANVSEGMAIINAAQFSGINVPLVNSNVVNTVVPMPLQVSLSPDPEPIRANTSLITYTIALKNNMASDATNVIITNTIPVVTGYVDNSASNGGFPAPSKTNTIVWPATTVSVGGTIVRTFKISVTSPLANGDKLTNIVSVTSAEGEKVENLSLTTTVAPMLFQISLSPNPEPIKSDTSLVTYTITLKNNTASVATNVIITNTIPSAADYVDGSSSNGGFLAISETNTIAWPAITVLSGNIITRTFQISVTSPLTNGDKLTNIVSVTSAEGEKVENLSLTTIVDEKRIYLPLILSRWPSSTPVSADQFLIGTATYQGTPVSDLSLDLRYYDGSTNSIIMTTATDTNGRYQFSNPPTDLSGDQKYYVVWSNTDRRPDYLPGWYCDAVDDSTPDFIANQCDFDVSKFEPESPENNATVTLPHTFRWSNRGQIGDSYQCWLLDKTSGYVWFSKQLGNVDSYTLTGLPDFMLADFTPNRTYVWFMEIHGPSGHGQTSVSDNRDINFTNSGTPPIRQPDDQAAKVIFNEEGQIVWLEE